LGGKRERERKAALGKNAPTLVTTTTYALICFTLGVGFKSRGKRDDERPKNNKKHNHRRGREKKQ
jgi:hypothetical protein